MAGVAMREAAAEELAHCTKAIKATIFFSAGDERGKMKSLEELLKEGSKNVCVLPNGKILELSDEGFPILYRGDYEKRCIPGVAISGVSQSAIFTTRYEAVRWAKFSLRGEINWLTWKAPQGQYPYETARDNENLSPSFIAKVGHWPETEEITVTVTKSQIRFIFDWWAKEADGDWNK